MIIFAKKISMSTAFNIVDLSNDFEFEEEFNNRYVEPKKLFKFLQENYSSYVTQIGTSVLGKPIYRINIGQGSKNILFWSQMHGNESTGTLALLDILKFSHKKSALSDFILSEYQLDIVMMLNPDGAEIWQRRNIEGIDINRDFIAKTSPEMRLLYEISQQKKYDLAFNLHDQRSIFGVSNTNNPATLAFLSPSVDEERSLNNCRKCAMSIIYKMFEDISQLIPNHISRFTDEFYPRASGDNFQKMGIPTILIEAGHFFKDYKRKQTRKYFTLSILSALYNFKKDEYLNNYEQYFSIPENNIMFYDIKITNVNISDNKKDTADIAIQYKEVIENGKDEISFIGIVEEIGDLSHFSGHLEYDAQGRKFSSKFNKYPKIGMLADFQLDEWFISNGKKLPLLS